MLSSRKAAGSAEKNGQLQCAGTVLDISIGGMKFTTPDLPEKVVEGVNVIFKLEEAKIKNEIQGEIVRISEENKQQNVHLQFQNLSELNRLYLQKFIASKNPIKVQ